MDYLVQSPRAEESPAAADDRPTCRAFRRRSPPGHPPGGAEALNSFGLVMQNLRRPD
jgi:hypothetical protein